jgi:hypothetical protein
MNGVAAIPTQMFNEQNYATGGIVAFQGGGQAGSLYSSPGEADIYAPSESEYVAPGPSVGSLDAYIREAAARRAEARKPSEAMLALERSMTDPSRFRDARDEARNMALLQAGLGILGGSSQYALQNIGRGASGAVDAYGQQMRDIRKQEREALGQRAALDVRKQEQALADIAAGESQYSAARKEALEERKIASREEIERQRAESAEERAELRNRGLMEAMQNRRDTDRAGFVADYVAGKREEGDKRSEAVLRLEGQQQFNNQQARFGLAEMQLQAQIIGQVNAEIAKRRAELTRGDREALRAWRASGKSEDEFWAGQKELALTSMYAELAARTGAPARPTTAAPSQGTPPARQSAPPSKLDLSKIEGVPAGSTLGKTVPGKGIEVLNNGKVIGHIKE